MLLFFILFFYQKYPDNLERASEIAVSSLQVIFLSYSTIAFPLCFHISWSTEHRLALKFSLIEPSWFASLFVQLCLQQEYQAFIHM